MPAQESVTLVGYQALQQRFDRLGSVDEKLLRLLGLQVVREAKARAPKKSMNLARTIAYQPIDKTQGRVVARAAYAPFVEFGTGIHGPERRRITPKVKKAMRWAGGPAGAFRLTGSVRSGATGAGFIFARSTAGMRPHPFLFPGARAAMSSVDFRGQVVATWEGRE